MGEVLLVRHGETEWNCEEVFRGRRDVGLNDRGREQARMIAEAMWGYRVAGVYSSPLSRAVETAKPVADALGIEVMVDDRLTDMSFGEWEGRPRTEVEEASPELYRSWLENPREFRAPGGESVGDVVARAWPAMNEVAVRHGDGVVVIVSHRVVCKALLCTAIGAGEAAFWRLRVDTGSISALASAGEFWVVTRMNDTSHLAELGDVSGADF